MTVAAMAGTLAPVAAIDVLDSLPSRRSCSKSTSISGGSPGAPEEMKRANKRSLTLGSTAVDAERVADGGIWRPERAPLAQYAAILGETHDVVDGEKIARIVEAGDQGRVRSTISLRTFFRHALGIPPGRAAAMSDPSSQPCGAPAAGWDGLVGNIHISARRARSRSGREIPVRGAAIRVRPHRERAAPFPAAASNAARALACSSFPALATLTPSRIAGDDILQVALVRLKLWLDHVVDGDQLHTGRGRQRPQLGQPGAGHRPCAASSRPARRLPMPEAALA